jgi:hypothetical protein
VKDLSCLSKDFSRIVIVDNNPFSFIVQPLNGIPCVPFSAGQHSDDQVTDNGHLSFNGSGALICTCSLIFFLYCFSADGGYLPAPEASLCPERCEASPVRKVSYARMVPKAWDPSN